MIKRIIQLLTLALLFPNGVAMAQTTVQDSMFWGGAQHRFRVYVPATVKCALVVHLHGYGSSGYLEQLYTNYMPIADTAGFVVAYPEGLVDPLGNQSWNVGWALQVNNDDVGFLSAFIDTMVHRYLLDPSAVFVSGISNGGFMAHRLACELSNKVAAIASVSGGMTPQLYASCSPANPVPVLEIHGTADSTIPYAGSVNPASMNIDSVVKRNAQLIGANPNPQVNTLSHNPNTVNGTSVEHYVYSGGPNGATSEFYKIIGGAHVDWPGFDNSTNNDFSAAKEIWRFFRNYRSCTPLGLKETAAQQNIRVYPNPTNGIVNVDLKGSDEYTSYEIVDSRGRVVRSGELSNESKLRFDMNGLTYGAYVLVLRGRRGDLREKITLE